MYNAPESKQKELQELKDKVKDSLDYAKDNNQRFNESKKFICDTALTNDQRNKLITLNKSAIEFNEIEAFVSRQLGEFAKQEPGFEVRASSTVGYENITEELINLMELIEGYLRYLLSDENTDNLSYKVFDDLLKGGFSVVRVYTDYINELEFQQEIKLERDPYPTMCGFDPMATQSHKGDGDYCFRIIAYKKEDAERIYGKDLSTKMSFSASFGTFNWSYKNNNQKIILICEYFKKEKRKKKIVRLSNGVTITMKEYKRVLELWEESGYIELPPAIVNERMTEIEVICRYILCENKILSYEETNYKYLPLVFIDGNSVLLEDVDGGSKRQMTRPYPWHLKGIQMLKNLAGQQIAYEIENTVAHKFIIALESIEMSQIDQLRNVQIADNIIYRSYMDGNKDAPVQPPREIQRTQIPPIITQTFSEASHTMQAILGSFDSVAGVQRNNASGEAIDSGAIQSSLSSSPYLKGFENGWNRIGKIILDLIPKYHVEARTIPVTTKDGKKEYKSVNNERNQDSTFLNYDPNMLNISIKMGVNSEVQKRVALNQMITLSKAVPSIGEFLNTAGLPFILKNMDMRGIESFIEEAEKWTEQMQQQKQMAMQKPKIDPMELKQQELQLKAGEIQQRTAIDAAKAEVDNRKVDIEFMKLLSKAKTEEITNQVKLQQAKSEDVRSAALLAIEMSKHEKDAERDKHDRIERMLTHKDKMEVEHKKVDSKNKKESAKEEIVEIMA